MAKPTAEQDAQIKDAARRGTAQGLVYTRAGLDFEARTNGRVWVNLSIEDLNLLLIKAERLDTILEYQSDK